jgi:cytochrome c oxidase subunit 2
MKPFSFLANSPMDGSFWLPTQSSSVAPVHDDLFTALLWISGFFVALIALLMIYFVIRYRATSEEQHVRGPTKNVALEIAWTAIPLLINIVLFYIGVKQYIHLDTPPSNAYEIQAVAQKWNWHFSYLNGATDPDLHVPVNQPIILNMLSADVIHSLYIPAFRVHKDIVPARSNIVWFTATQPGEYDLFCTQYCGTGHSEMIAKCIVHPSKADFQQWLAGISDIWHDQRHRPRSPAQVGQILYNAFGCAACHTIDGTTGTGPTWKDLYDSSVPIEGASTVLADEGYLRESVLNPPAKVVRGYQNIMPSYAGRLSDPALNAIIGFIKIQSGLTPTAQRSAALAPATQSATNSTPATQTNQGAQ